MPRIILARKSHLWRLFSCLALFSLITLSSLLPISAVAASSNRPATNVSLTLPAGAPFDHIVTIMMENQGLCDVYTGCGGTATYQSQLADQNTLIMTWGTINHNSEPNYVSLLGAIPDCTPNSCTGDGQCCFTVPGTNLVDRMEAAGISWTAWAEDASGSGTCSFSPPRNGDHFGFIDFQDMNNASRCAHFLTTASSGDTEFIASLTTGAPNFIWLTPNDNDNGHDSGVSGGDSYLSTLVPKVLSSPLFSAAGSKAALLILYDEGYTACNNTGGTGECVYASLSGPVAKKATQLSPANASHYSFASMIETAWGLSSINQNDVGAPNLQNAFAPCTSNCGSTSSGNGSNNNPTSGLFGLSNQTWLIIIAGLIGVVAVLTVVTVRARARAKRARATVAQQ